MGRLAMGEAHFLPEYCVHNALRAAKKAFACLRFGALTVSALAKRPAEVAARQQSHLVLR
jgi:hypothetical protein